MRQPIIAGNWKMHKTAAEAETLIRDLIPLVAGAPCEVVVCPPFTALARAAAAVAGSNVRLGAQNVHWEAEGAFTGEISASMLAEAGVKYPIVGHSERRQYFGETDEGVNRRARAALAAGMSPIVCLGERLDDREAGRTHDVVIAQFAGAMRDIEDPAHVRRIVIAYEPVWAIGTGKVATPAQAQEVHALLRQLLTDRYDAATAAAVRLQYGGSMKPGNAAELLAQPDIDGGLIGGASLKPEAFAAIVAAAA